MTWNRYYVTRTQLRTDGDVNIERKELFTEASARSQFATYEAQAYTDTTYPYIGIMLCNCHMQPLKHTEIQTSYVAPTTETESATE